MLLKKKTIGTPSQRRQNQHGYIGCTSLLGAAALWCLVLTCLHHGAADGQLVKGEGGSSATYVYTDLFDSYNFVQDQVVLKYRESTGERAQVLADYEAGKLDFVLQDAPLPDQLNPPGAERFVEVPILGNAVSFVHSVYLPPINGTTPNLNLSRSTLARIFAGAVRTWDDDAIKADNPRLPEGTLPPDNITLVIRSGQPGINAVLLKALSAFDAGFASVLAASNGSLDGLPPSLEGRAKAFPTKGSQFGYFYRNVTKALVYAANEYATLLRLSGYFRRTNVTFLINSAGQALPPNSTTIQWTLREFQPSGRGEQLPRYLIDGQSPTSYPVCFFTTLVLRRNLTGVRQCLGTRAYLNYNVWALSNQRSKLTVPSYGISNLLPAYQSRVMNILPTVACDGESALRYSSMSGLGVTAPFMSSWASFYDAATTPLQITYYDETTLSDGSEQMKAGNVDFGTTLVAAPSLVARQSSSSDLKYLPMAGFALSIGYNVPELVGKPPLVLDLYTVSLFFTGEITQWNDTRIQTLNPSASLPNANISLPLAPDDEAMVMLTQALASVNPDIAQVLAQNSSNTLAALSLSPFSLVIETGLAMYVNQTAYTLAAVPHYIVSSFQDSYEFIAEASLLDRQGNPVAPDTQGVLAAMRESETQINGGLTPSTLSTQTNGTYPLSGYAYTLISMSEMTDCTRAKELVQWLWWSISSSSGSQLAAVNNIVLPLESTKRAILSTLVDVTCQGVYVNALRPCVQDGVICSNEGTCANGVCLCNATRTGTYCESVKTDDLSTGAIVGIVVGVVVPVLVLLCLLVLAVLLILLCCRNRREDEEWMIDASEIEFAELLGAGGFGEVRKAVWRGTEVAVKTVASGYITNDIRNAFIDEVRLMTSLRHPNVVLFMGAATKPPKMCIVMEYMSLGSLYDVLHNELLPDIPHQLRIKMMRQAAKGMYFLHSSGIVHRDLKSLNLLLDSKWNVKVSDFGLTKFQDQLKKENQNQLLELGSIHWTAPEVLSEMHGIDLEAADVYSFGIVLWEVISREDVYSGMSPAAVAVAVLRDDLRPEVPEATPESYASLMVNCWDKDPTVRPKFLEIMTRLESFEEKSSTGWGGASTSSTMSGISGWGGGTSDKGSSSTGGSHSSNGSTSSDGKKEAVRGVKPPTGEVTIVFTDVVRAGALWEFNAEAMKDATILHNQVVRGLLAQHKGYEVVSTTREGAGGEGSLFVVFQDAARALEWCMAVQLALLEVQWPAALFAHPAAAEEWGDTDDRLIYRGLRVRMGVHVGQPRKVFNAMSRRAEYMGPAVNTAARITTMSHGGQIVVSQAVYDRIRDSGLAKEKKRLASLGKFDMPDSPQGVTLFELRTRKLEARFFGGTTTGVAAYTSDSNPSGGDGSDHHGKARRRTVTHSSGGVGGGPDDNGDDDEQEVCSTGSGVLVGGDHVVQMEESFLASANLCRWIIDYGDIKVGRQVGMGSYGLVFHGRWKGIEVAVKRFIKQKLTERRLLEFRAEMAFLSELHHPNVVVFIGACVKMPNLCIVTEFVKQGALKDLLYVGPHGSTMVKLGESTRGGGGGGQVVVKLEWKQRLRMLRSAALGVNYLHTLEPVIIHRDLKSSNLLVDENWNVKVADFGFARLKEDNATMTRCGTPCWTAPEVIRGERYSEKADVYSFGIIMWEVMARKQPFAGRNFMGVSLDVLEGKRPQVPADCPEEFKKVMTKCWHAKPDKRPTMEEVVAFLDKLIGDGGDLV